MPIEARLRDAILIFDAPVLQLYDRGRLGGGHYHVELLRSVTIDGEFVHIVTGDTTPLLFIFDNPQRPAAEQLVAAVNAAIDPR